MADPAAAPVSRHYAVSLAQTLRTTASAYGYALSIATSISILTSVHGKPHAGELFLFVAGGLCAFAALELLLLAVARPAEDSEDSGQGFPFAGALNCFSVPAALGSTIGLAYAIHGALAWLLAPLAATAVYMLVVAVQVMVVERARAAKRQPA